MSPAIQKREVLAEQVANQIRDGIRSGKLNPGKRLVESDLALDMGVSRSAVREALRSLEKEGLVTASPFRGTYVTELEEKDVEEIYPLRFELEKLAIRMLIRNLDKDKLHQLQSVVDKMKRVAANSHEITEAVDVDLEFHRTICELAGNKRLLSAWLNLSYQLSNFIANEDGPYGHDTFHSLFQPHYTVFESIKDRDVHLAVKKLQGVIEHGYRNAKKRCRSRKNIGFEGRQKRER